MPRTTAEWKKSFEIFEKYPSGADGLAAAEHDEVFASIDISEVSPEDLATLKELGWGLDDWGESLHSFV